MSKQLNSYVDFENTQRSEKYKKNVEIESKILQLNNVLAEVETYQHGLAEYPTIFIYGLPRSGTTLLYQLITSALDVGYINNLMARFWRSPLYGIALSQSLLGQQTHNQFHSDYGKTGDILGPHEYSYFWHAVLNLRTEEDIVQFGKGAINFDREKLRMILLNMQHAFGLPVVFKAMEIGNNPSIFSELLPQSIFVYIERDLEDVALSILKARKAYYANVDTWWATYPWNYQELKSLPYDQQIVGQMLGLKSMYEKGLATIPDERKLCWHYQELCERPQSFIDELMNKVSAETGYQMHQRREKLQPFHVRKNQLSIKDDERQLLKTLESVLSGGA